MKFNFYSMDHDNNVRTTKRHPRNATALGRSKLQSPDQIFHCFGLKFTRADPRTYFSQNGYLSSFKVIYFDVNEKPLTDYSGHLCYSNNTDSITF